MTNAARATTPPLLEAQNLHSYYGSSHILRGIHLSVHSGETVALMGRNGMGKSTLLKSILGIVRPRLGRVYVRGREVTLQNTYQIAQQGIAYVPEGRGIFPQLSVRENLIMAARCGVQGQCTWTFERIMATFPRLGERIHQGGGQLSGGEQQMLTIARALMTNPDLLILDEATEGLAPMIARDIWRIVEDIGTSGIATIIVDKNHSMLTRMSHRAVILVKGEVVFNDKSTLLRQNPALVAQYLGV